MRWWGILVVSFLVVVAAPAAPRAEAPAEGVATAVEDAASPPPLPLIGYGAMPGGLRVATAEALPAGTLDLALLSGYGYRKGLLGGDHTLGRALASFAAAYAPIPRLTVGLSFDGRYDKNKGFRQDDDGYVGDPHVLVRYAAPLGRVMLGGQLGVWVPGKDAPSIAASATSVDLRGLLSIDAGLGLVTLDAGFRVDNSAASVDDRARLTLEDQVSLGVSDFHAALIGASVRVPLGARAYGELEGSADLFVGSGAPGPVIRGTAMVGVAVSDAVSLVGYLELARVPDVEYRDAARAELVLIPFEPAVTGGLGVQARFGGPRRAAPVSQITVNARPAPVAVIETADVTGVVLDDAGKPVVAASVTVKLKNHTGTAVTDSRGAYLVARLPIGKTVDGRTELDDTGAEVSAEVASKKPAAVTLTLARGANAVPPISLDPALPPGQLRAVIINVGTSRPVAGATVAIEPGDVTATSGPDGKFTVDLPPGHYKLTVSARGLAQQQLDVTIEQNGVAIKNIDMHR